MTVREKGTMYGVSSLSDTELLQLIGIKTPIALSGATTENLTQREKTLFFACLEVAQRHRMTYTRIKIRSSADSFHTLLPYMEGSPVEKFYAIYLNRNNTVLGIREISTGGISSTLVDPKVVFKYAVSMGASAVIISHCHPSGNKKPSEADMKITKTLAAGAKVLDMALLDHIIIAEGNGYLSFADEGLI
jgi:DNA repair protein RadC